MKKRVFILCGPTASGKSDAAVSLAKKIDGEIISADSMQIYKELFIGTARPTEEEMQKIPHYLLGYVEPNDNYSVALYKEAAIAVIEDILSRGKTPIIAGGTGLYINSLTYNLDFGGGGEDSALREELSRKFDENPTALYNELCAKDPKSAERIHFNDKKRIVRRLEILSQSSDISYDFNEKSSLYDFCSFSLSPERSILYDRINRRVDKMMNRGLEAEARRIYDKYGENIKAFAAIGYKEFIPYFKGEETLEKVIYDIKLNSRHYAKRQITWFKRDERITWLDPIKLGGAEKTAEEILRIIEENNGI